MPGGAGTPPMRPSHTPRRLPARPLKRATSRTGVTSVRRMRKLGARTLIFHQEPGTSYDRVRYRPLVREGLAAGHLVPWRAFREGGRLSFVFRLSPASEVSGDAALDEASRRELAGLPAELRRVRAARRPVA